MSPDIWIPRLKNSKLFLFCKNNRWNEHKPDLTFVLHLDVYLKQIMLITVSEMNQTLCVIYHDRHFIRRSIMWSLQHKCCDEKNNLLYQFLVLVYAISCPRAFEIQRERLRGLGLPGEVRRRYKINTRTQKRKTHRARAEVTRCHLTLHKYRLKDRRALGTRDLKPPLSCSPGKR